MNAGEKVKFLELLVKLEQLEHLVIDQWQAQPA